MLFLYSHRFELSSVAFTGRIHQYTFENWNSLIPEELFVCEVHTNLRIRTVSSRLKKNN